MSVELFSLKEIQQLERFTGDDSKFDEWIFRTTAVIRDKPGDWDALLQAAKAEGAPIVLARLDPALHQRLISDLGVVPLSSFRSVLRALHSSTSILTWVNSVDSLKQA